MSDILEYRMRHNGLGIIAIELCFLLATNKKIHAFVPNENHMLFDFKRVFKISDDRLKIIVEPNSQNDQASSDFMKSFTPYYTPDVVELFGRDYPTGQRNKPCIGLAMHHAGGSIGNDNPDPLGEQRPVKDFPYNKFATYETYSQIVKLITNSGYDVITFNNSRVSVEYKSFLLNNLCDCVIGYEGGLAQLAHTLKVPTIILPWNSWIDGDTHWKDGSPWDPRRHEAHKYHIDRKTYFLDRQEEIHAWDRDKLRSIIDSLYNNQGNNFLLDADLKLDQTTLIADLPYEKNVLGPIPVETRDFILKHIPNPCIS